MDPDLQKLDSATDVNRGQALYVSFFVFLNMIQRKNYLIPYYLQVLWGTVWYLIRSESQIVPGRARFFLSIKIRGLSG